MEELISQLTTCFDLKLMVSIVVCTYIALKALSSIIGTHSYVKQVITFAIAAILCVIYYYYIHLTLEQLIPTYMLSVAFYNVIIKKVVAFMGINYKK